MDEEFAESSEQWENVDASEASDTDDEDMALEAAEAGAGDVTESGNGEGGSEAAADGEHDPGFAEFVVKYPRVDPREIPGQVWEAVRGGKTLSEAWAKWVSDGELAQLRAENRRLARELENERRTSENRRKSAGSRRGPRGATQDEIDRIWEEE